VLVADGIEALPADGVEAMHSLCYRMDMVRLYISEGEDVPVLVFPIFMHFLRHISGFLRPFILASGNLSRRASSTDNTAVSRVSCSSRRIIAVGPRCCLSAGRPKSGDKEAKNKCNNPTLDTIRLILRDDCQRLCWNTLRNNEPTLTVPTRLPSAANFTLSQPKNIAVSGSSLRVVP
jgi:hypothetical protein